ncbi:MAG: hypothetical protein H7A09_05265 [Oceanospirillaceae bacterium]|nr:hypothetical protein [Oceanospirillaceae bacterium]MCP5334146.1 hypothetical protein [Oceanospirillaceae bacterium]
MKIIKQFRDMNNQVVASIFCEEETGMMMDIWSVNPHATDCSKLVMEYCFSHIRENNIVLWLCNQTKLAEFLGNAEGYEISELQHTLHNSKLQKIALVCRKKDLLNNSALFAVYKELAIESETFDNQVMAMRWLTSTSPAADIAIAS